MAGPAERLRARPPGGRAAVRLAGPRVLLVTEGTYPYATGGVTSWCDLVVRGLAEVDWRVLPIVAGRRGVVCELPAQATLLPPIELWSEGIPHGAPGRRAQRRAAAGLPGRLARALIGWAGDLEALTDALTWCRRNPAAVRRAFRSQAGWAGFRTALAEVLDERVPEAGTPPQVDLVEASLLYQSLYWVARTAAVPTPETDVMLVTTAGWAAIPAIVDRALRGTPIVLAEHGVYVREAYLAGARTPASPGARFIATRLALGLARAAYGSAQVVSPVTPANARWEEGLGVDPARIHVVHNGLSAPADPVPAPGTRTVVSVGRIDPLKDIHTMLRAAHETLRHEPDATFVHHGPVTPGEEDYGRSCRALHAELGLGDRFRFMGRTTDADGVVRGADVVVMARISEALPISLLEAMAAGRPVVSTGVGGVRDVLRGCGVITPPGDAHAIAMGIVTLLRRPDLAALLGCRGHRRLTRMYDEASCVSGYRQLLRSVAAGEPPRAAAPADERVAA
jgi:glycosyltransferase involved in cell wall biosynthesis